MGAVFLYVDFLIPVEEVREKPSGLLRRRSCGTNAYSHFRSLTLDPTPSRFGSWLVPKPRRNSSTSGAKFGKRSFPCSKIDIRVLSHKFGQRFRVSLLNHNEAKHGQDGVVKPQN